MSHAILIIAIDRPLADVFAFVADGETAPLWQAAVLDARRASADPPGMGATYHDQRTNPEQREKTVVEATREITVYEPNRTVTFATRVGPVEVVDTYTFRAVGAGTRVSFDFERHAVPRSGPFATSREAADLTALKDVMEGREIGIHREVDDAR